MSGLINQIGARSGIISASPATSAGTVTLAGITGLSYEEGDFTPTIKTASATETAYDVNEGYYTRVGRVVHISGRIQTTNINALDGAHVIFLGGLPFTVADSHKARAGLGWSGHSYALGGEYAVCADVESDDTKAYLRVWYGTGGTSSMIANNWSSDGAGYFSVSYVVA